MCASLGENAQEHDDLGAAAVAVLYYYLCVCVHVRALLHAVTNGELVMRRMRRTTVRFTHGIMFKDGFILEVLMVVASGTGRTSVRSRYRWVPKF
jgi:hypothetical protein